MAMYENVVNAALECDPETTDFLAGFARLNGFTYEVRVRRKYTEGVTGEVFSERVYDVEIVCPRYRFEKIMEEV